MIDKPKNLGILFVIPSSIEQNENVTFLLDKEKKTTQQYKIFHC